MRPSSFLMVDFAGHTPPCGTTRNRVFCALAISYTKAKAMHPRKLIRRAPIALAIVLSWVTIGDAPAFADFTLIPAMAEAKPFVPADHVRGFGKDVPLLLAAAEIVPPPLLVEFPADAGPNKTLSWEGRGRPWRDVLGDALAAVQMTFHEEGGAHVVITPVPVPVTMASAPTPIAPLQEVAIVASPHNSAPAPLSSQQTPTEPSIPPCGSPDDATSTSTIWTTVAGTTIRQQIGSWITNDPNQYRLAPEKEASRDAYWRIDVEDSCRGSFLDALTRLRDGFWEDPRPDIEATPNNVIILRRLGAVQ
jgi:hypothetical protein